MKRRIPAAILVLALGILAARGLLLSLKGGSDAVYREGNDPSLPVLDLYTSDGATTPQIALLAAIRDGSAGRLFNINIHIWRNPDDLLSHMLSGNGDLWVGHTEGFALARSKGAPVSIFLCTSFRKFYIVSATARSWTDMNGRTLAYAPPGSPAVPLLHLVCDKTGSGVRLQPFQGRELSLMVESGRVTDAVLPEPLVSLFLSRHPSLRIVCSVEELFSSVTGRQSIIPVAGIAVNENTARRYPRQIAELRRILLDESARLERNRCMAATVFPPYFHDHFPPGLLRDSLSRDILLARTGESIKDELMGYLRLVHPGLFSGDNPLDRDRTFIWTPCDTY